MKVQKRLRTILIISGILLFAINSKSQSQISGKDKYILYKNEIGIDIANILTFLERNPQSYFVNYKRYFKSESALRFGVNLNLSSIQEEGYYYDTRLGYELGKQMEKWRLFYGFDSSYSFSKSNLQSTRIHRFGVEPLLGFKYYFSKHFSISTEMKLNFFYYLYQNSDTFDQTANSNEFQVSIGSVGMICLNYHF